MKENMAVSNKIERAINKIVRVFMCLRSPISQTR
jgi:hypothetical protein